MARVEGQQVEIIIRSPVQHASAKIDGGIDERGGGAAIFRLDVIRRFACFHVRIVTEEHSSIRLTCARDGDRFAGVFPPNLTDWRSNRYYSSSPMSDSGLHTYAPLLLHLLIATALAGALTAASVLIGWRRPSRAKQQPYECGMEPIGDAREPFSVKFYLVAMVFILFDVEAIFLYPWAYIFRSLRWYGFGEMMIYIAVLLVGYLYLWKKGALDWHK
jgi:NADH-quinone oxidoreductase subunit A